MKAITFDALQSREIDELKILSISHSLYVARVVVKGIEYHMRSASGNGYKASSLEIVRQDFSSCCVKKMTVTHNSAYDEMMGQAVRAEPNTLVYEVNPAPLE